MRVDNKQDVTNISSSHEAAPSVSLTNVKDLPSAIHRHEQSHQIEESIRSENVVVTDNSKRDPIIDSSMSLGNGKKMKRVKNPYGSSDLSSSIKS